jgi:hypothetical protein
MNKLVNLWMAWKIQCQLELDDNLWITQKGPLRAWHFQGQLGFWMTIYELHKSVKELLDRIKANKNFGWQFRDHAKKKWPKGLTDSRPTIILDDNLGIQEKKVPKDLTDSRPTSILDDNLWIMERKWRKAEQIQDRVEFWMTIYELWKKKWPKGWQIQGQLQFWMTNLWVN